MSTRLKTAVTAALTLVSMFTCALVVHHLIPRSEPRVAWSTQITGYDAAQNGKRIARVIFGFSSDGDLRWKLIPVEPNDVTPKEVP